MNVSDVFSTGTLMVLNNDDLGGANEAAVLYSETLST